MDFRTPTNDNTCYSVLRGRQRERARRASEDEFLEVAGEVGEEAERLALSRALASLSPDQREVVHLKVFEGCSFSEIAGLQGSLRTQVLLEASSR